LWEWHEEIYKQRLKEKEEQAEREKQLKIEIEVVTWTFLTLCYDCFLKR
jgi:hypothetical protein